MQRLFPLTQICNAKCRVIRSDSGSVPAWRRMWCCWPALFLVCVVGCSDGGVRYPVRPDVANQTLNAVLSHWKNGGKPDELRDADPQIVVQDFDRASGTRLTEFAVADDAAALDANLSVQVRLELTHADGRTETRNVWYLVSTDPVLTVFRDLFHP